jgi:hypothetical protein
MVSMMRIAVVLLLASLASCTTPDQQSAREEPVCDIRISRVDGIVISVDVASSCIGDDWNLEYRLLSSGLVTTSRRDRPCGSQTHVELLSMPGLADLKVVGWIYSESAGQRVECRVAPSSN